MTDLGQRQEAAGVAVTVLSMERTPIAQPAAPYPGPAGQPHDQITLELLVENVARPTFLFYAGTALPEGSGSVRLLDTNGQTYQPAPFTPHRRYQRQGSDLLEGDRLRHTLVYAVPPNTHDLRLRFDPRLHNPGTYPIEVNLERAAASAAPLPAAAPLPPGALMIGAPQQIGAFAVTVLNVERRAHVPEPSPSPAPPTTSPYTHDVLVDVLFENTSMEERDYNLLGGYLKDQNGYEYVDPLNGFGRLSSGERARVTFVFTVREQADGFQLGMLLPTFTPAPISSPSAIGSPSANSSVVASSSPTAGPPVIFFDLQQRSPTAQSPAPSGPVGVLLGERQEANGIGFTVQYVTRTPRIETMTPTPAPRGDQSSAPADASTPRIETMKAAPGNTFVFVDVLLENMAQQAQPALTERFTLTDDAGRTYRSVERGITAQPPFLVADPLLANDFRARWGGV